ncbi:PaaX family transcriptional regulator C-terminal domain-containing protein [Primorskyibacter sp. 2E233]|uniref:PaaX family transcriptional regulator C-terminal domain-containing protein n=1 Tax=Primorskyibacter sp. 2E233 TaxID=3413431 RepID=UPI003BF449A8
MPGQSSEIAREIAPFADCGPLRTWSVIATIMGDLLRDPPDCISGQSLASLVGKMGISEQALRVAVHRLKKDGWIESRREGRESFHYLSAQARQETEAVRPLIYGGVPPDAGDVTLVVAPPDLAQPLLRILPKPATQLSARCALIAESKGVLDERLLTVPLGPAEIPDWVAEVLAPKDLRAEFAMLTKQTLHAVDHLPEAPEMRLVLRLVILHHWRRLVLRQPPLAEALLPAGWEGRQARTVVTRALDMLPRVHVGNLKYL